jgi:hypothetical protein
MQHKPRRKEDKDHTTHPNRPRISGKLIFCITSEKSNRVPRFLARIYVKPVSEVGIEDSIDLIGIIDLGIYDSEFRILSSNYQKSMQY